MDYIELIVKMILMYHLVKKVMILILQLLIVMLKMVLAKRLAKVFKELDKKGVYVMLSNHNTNLINELYKDYNIHVIEAKRNINANGKKRGKVEEVIITNYENKRGFNI